ncbi:IS1182 family transposase [Vagococcus carniphilus]|nr:IS1182 family transposase [Vagococcus carniphilus]QNN72671.1 IS1182 family transposase [Vagococcus carniphilus]
MYKNYNMKQVTLSLDLEIYLEKNDIAFAINELVESIPSHVFSVFDHQMGTSSYDPRMMLKLILCGYTQSNFSGRKIEAMTKDSIRTRWLTQSQFPNFRTINRFRVNPLVQPILQECFIQFRNQLVSQKLIEEDAIFIDGTKLEANANKYSFVWRKSTTRFDDSLTEKSKIYYKQLVKEKIIPSIHNEDEEWDDKQLNLIADSIETKVSELTEQIDDTEDVTLRKELRRQRKEPKKALKAFREFSDRKKKYKQQYQIFKERNSFSKIDMDATFMRMKEDHMMNGQLKPAYNIQIATNNQYVLAYDTFSNPTDFKTMIPFLTTIKESYFELPNYIVADAGYGSEENYQAILDDFERTPLITYTMYQKEQTKKYKQNPFITNNWKYNELTDSYTCPNNRELHFRNYSTRNDKQGFTKQLKMYECETCIDCPVRSLCTRAKSNKSRVIQKNGNWEYFKAHARELLSDDVTGAIYRRRKIDVEPAFGNLKANLSFNRFSVRGQDKVTQELGFAFMALNLRKLSKFRKDIDRKIRKNKNSKMINLILEFLFCFKRLLGQALSSIIVLITSLDSCLS